MNGPAMAYWSSFYRFRQGFAYSADRALAWCLDYAPGDVELMGDSGTRSVKWIADDAVLLTDRMKKDGKTILKRKLVRIDRDRRSWTSTHLIGPTRYSQFLYQIEEDGANRSALEFTGLQIDLRAEAPAPATRQKRVQQLTDEDSATWRVLAKAMAIDLG